MGYSTSFLAEQGAKVALRFCPVLHTCRKALVRLGSDLINALAHKQLPPKSRKFNLTVHAVNLAHV